MLTHKNARILAFLLPFCLCARAIPALANKAPGLSGSPLTFQVDTIIQRADTLRFTVTISAKDQEAYVLLGYDETPDTTAPGETMSYLELASGDTKTMLRVGVPRITVNRENGFSQSARTVREDGMLRYEMEISGISPTPDMDIDVRVTFESRLLYEVRQAPLEDGIVQTEVAEGPLLRSALRFFSGADERRPSSEEDTDEADAPAEESSGNG